MFNVVIQKDLEDPGVVVTRLCSIDAILMLVDT